MFFATGLENDRGGVPGDVCAHLCDMQHGACDRNSSTTRCTARCGWQLARHQEFWANFKCTVNFGSKLTILLRPCQSSAIRPACLWNDPWHVRLKALQSVGAWSNRALAFMTLLVSSWLRVRLDAVFLGNTCYHWLSFKNTLHSSSVLTYVSAFCATLIFWHLSFYPNQAAILDGCPVP